MVALAASRIPPLPFLLCYNKGIKQIHALNQAFTNYLGCSVQPPAALERLLQGTPKGHLHPRKLLDHFPPRLRAVTEDELQHGTCHPLSPPKSSQREVTVRGGKMKSGWMMLSQVLSCETWNSAFKRGC